MVETREFKCRYVDVNALYLVDNRDIVRSYLNEENKCNDNFYTPLFQRFIYYIQGTRNYELSPVKDALGHLRSHSGHSIG